MKRNLAAIALRCVNDLVRKWHYLKSLLGDGKKSYVVLVLILGMIGSIPLVILTPPFQVPDEVAHFCRAYQLSELHLRAEVINGSSGGTLPSSLLQIVKAKREGIKYLATPAPLAMTLKLSSVPLDSSRRQFIAYPGSAFYSPLPYLPQALGIAIGRALGSGPLALLYWGRLFNCLSALGLLVLAVKFMPFAEELVMFAGLLPMSLYLDASLSPDAAVIGCALVFSALAIRSDARGGWGAGDLWVATAVATVFSSVKPVYAPMLLAAVIPSVFRQGKAALTIRSHTILLGIVLGVTAGWFLFAESTMTTPVTGTHPTLQIAYILHHPILLMRAYVDMLGIVPLLGIYVTGVGTVGWLTVLLQPGIVYLLPLVSIFLFWKLGVHIPLQRSIKRAIWYFTLVLASSMLIVTAAYVMWTQVGTDYAVGVQGRYFIPLLVLAGVAVIEWAPGRHEPAPQWQRLACIAVVSVMEIASMGATIVQAFHLF